MALEPVIKKLLLLRVYSSFRFIKGFKKRESGKLNFKVGKDDKDYNKNASVFFFNASLSAPEEHTYHFQRE